MHIFMYVLNVHVLVRVLQQYMRGIDILYIHTTHVLLQYVHKHMCIQYVLELMCIYIQYYCGHICIHISMQ